MKSLSIKKIAYILIINLITIFIITYNQNDLRNKFVNINIDFIGSTEIDDLNERLSSNSIILGTKFNSLQKKISSIFKQVIHSSDKFNVIIYDSYNLDPGGLFDQNDFNTYIRTQVELNSEYNNKEQYIDHNEILVKIQKLFNNEMDKGETEIRRRENNIRERTLFFTNRLNDAKMKTSTRESITNMISSYELSVYKNEHLYELIRLHKVLIKKNFNDLFNIETEIILLKNNDFEFLEKIFAYLIFVNSIIYIFLRYYNTKN